MNEIRKHTEQKLMKKNTSDFYQIDITLELSIKLVQVHLFSLIKYNVTWGAKELYTKV